MAREVSAQPYGTGELPRPALLILTGASHSGKSSVARAIVALASAPLALLSVDSVLDRTLMPKEDRWSEIPLAYELIEAQVPVLLDRRWPVVVESTFTFVDASGNGEFHPERLNALAGLAMKRRVAWLVCQLSAEDEVLRARVHRSSRLDETIVLETARVHLTAELPVSTVRVRSDELGSEEIARQLISLLDSG